MISDMNGANTKADFRSYLKERIRLFVDNASLKSAAESRILSSLTPFLSSKHSSIGAYSALSNEPNLSNLYSSGEHSWCFPKITSNAMSFLKIEDYNQLQWVADPLGFRYPASGADVGPQQLDVILVPGLGFSSYGERLGRGKGYYDQYLAKFKGLIIGVCFDCQWTEGHLPVDDWDIKMNYIITESKCVEVKD